MFLTFRKSAPITDESCWTVGTVPGEPVTVVSDAGVDTKTHRGVSVHANLATVESGGVRSTHYLWNVYPEVG